MNSRRARYLATLDADAPMRRAATPEPQSRSGAHLLLDRAREGGNVSVKAISRALALTGDRVRRVGP